MASDLPDRIRDIVGFHPGIGEIRMFGGLCFTLDGNMLVGVTKSGDLLARVGDEAMAQALERAGATPMVMGERTMKGFVLVDEGVLDDPALRDWLSTSMALVGRMPPKEKKPAKARARPGS